MSNDDKDVQDEWLRRNSAGIIGALDKLTAENDARMTEIKALRLALTMAIQEHQKLLQRVNILQYGQVQGSTT